MTQSFQHKVLIVDDDEVDRMLLERAFKRVNSDVELLKASNGEEALSMLKGDSAPDIIILDIRMPILDGRETLRRIKNNECLKHIPVIMNSTSSDRFDVDYCYQNHANGYIVKPNNLVDSDNVVRTLVNFWLKTCALPKIRLV